MKPKSYSILVWLLLSIIIIAFYIFNPLIFSEKGTRIPEVKSSSSPKASALMKKARDEYFFKLFRDPATNKIPHNIRSRELTFAQELSKSLKKSSRVNTTQWKEAGPIDVGGRTRALAVDITNPNTIIAGGVSGGIWKSTDNGSTWKMKSTSTQLLSVTSIAQDPRAGNTNTWYYTTGEYTSNSAIDAGYTANYYGNGVYKSTDNGESWNVLLSTTGTDPNRWDGDFDYAIKVVVSPTTGTVFVAAIGQGIFKSTDGGSNFTMSLGGLNQHIFSDIDAAPNGNLVATLSIPFQGITPDNQPGVYKSINDGDIWTSIKPNTFPAEHLRSVITFAPSNPDVVYVLTNTGQKKNDLEDDRFHKISFSSGASSDRSANLPNFTDQGGISAQVGYYNSQNNYDMVVAVKPDDENFVLIGGTNLFRSFDGFATKPTSSKSAWIGGYHPQSFGYPNFHADVHSFSFDPTDPNKMWWGNDGGLTYTTDIRNNSFAETFPWQGKNNGYNVTQFYQISIPPQANDHRIMGGTQDNGTPFFIFDGTNTSNSIDASSGDGAYSYFGNSYAYTSSQNGNVTRINYNSNKIPDFNQGWTTVFPKDAKNQLFINPYTVDPNDENYMYYLAGNVLWRNNQLGTIPNYEQEGTNLGWTQLNVSVPQSSLISTLTISNNPAHILYYATTDFQNAPKIYKLENSTTANGPAQEISIPNAADGAYVHSIALNPDDADEILIAFSNYNVVGLYYSSNGGQSYTPVEGNLEGTQQNPGPSIRAANILPTSSGNIYFVATSIGIFSTTQLNGNNTAWVQEGANEIGNVVVNYIASRKSDGRIVAATHGRGAFAGIAGTGGGNAVLSLSTNQINLSVIPDGAANGTFSITNTGSAPLAFTIIPSGEPALSNKPAPKPEINLSFSNKMNNELSTSVFEIMKKKSEVENLNPRSENKTLSEHELILDDGDSFADGYLGAGGTVYYYWANEFQLDKDFSLEGVKFNMKTETQNTNELEIFIIKDDIIIFDTVVTKDLSQAGKWYEFQFPQYMLNSLKFSNGQTFYIGVAALNTSLTFPAGFDEDGLKPGHSYYAYYDPAFGFFTGWANLNTLAQNGAWLIRAVGGQEQTNQQPVAVAQVAATAQVGDAVVFDGSQSTDDGQIVQYNWDFGDQSNSSQSIATHTYSEAKTYNYSLTVTDNEGLTGNTSGQIVITGGTGTNHLSVNPISGTINPGESRLIVATYDATGLTAGNYQAQLTINSNGGNTTIPVNVEVSLTSDISETGNIPDNYFVEQNYPNPFNPSTKIKYGIPERTNVKLIIYDINGKEIIELVNNNHEAGFYEMNWNGTNKSGSLVSSGIYFYVVEAGRFKQSRKMIFMK